MVARASQRMVEPEIEPPDVPPTADFEMADSKEDLRAVVEQGHALVRIQNGVLQRLAIERPRNDAKVAEAVLRELDLAPELAVKNYYSLPFKQRNRDTGQLETVYVEGPNVRAMENIARRWGNCAVSSAVLEVTEEKATIAGMFLDYESGYFRTAPISVTRTKHKKGGGTYRLDQSKWQLEIAKACSIAERNASQKALPQWLVKRYFDRCKAIAAAQERKGGKQPSWKTVLAGFAKWEVTAEQLETFVGHPLDDVAHLVTDEELARLRGIRNSLEDPDLDVTAAEFFPSPEKKLGTVDDIIAAGATVTAGTVSGKGAVGIEKPGPASPAGTESSVSTTHGEPTQGEGKKKQPPIPESDSPVTKAELWKACVSRAARLGVADGDRDEVAMKILDAVLQKHGVESPEQLTSEKMAQAIADALNAKKPS